jgi:hypothetical protein
VATASAVGLAHGDGMLFWLIIIRDEERITSRISVALTARNSIAQEIRFERKIRIAHAAAHP